MNRQDKEIAIKSLKKNFETVNGSFLVGIKGMTVEDTLVLRKNLRTQGGSMHVAKNTLMKIAAKGVPGFEDLIPYFKEQVAIIFAENDVPSVAKIVAKTAEDNEKFVIVAGCFEHKAASKDQVVFVASLPSREVLVAQLAGTLKAPISTLAYQLNMLMTKLAVALKQVEEQKQK
ncbi:50S ribosomal protein L10 [Candidatus Dependentiae bacterium]|nr:50S ribosomal protein L10 [Candidatus Dependentiae bacterium]